MRERLENWVTNLVAKSDKLAVLTQGDRAIAAATEEQQAFKDACYAAAGQRRAEFIREVDGQDHEFWVKTAAKYAAEASGVVTPASLTADALAVAADAASNLTTEEQKALETALAGKTKARDILAIVSQHMLQKGQRGPGAAPASSGEREAPSFSTLRDYASAYTRHEITREAYWDARNRNSRGQLPD